MPFLIIIIIHPIACAHVFSSFLDSAFGHYFMIIKNIVRRVSVIAWRRSTWNEINNKVVWMYSDSEKWKEICPRSHIRVASAAAVAEIEVFTKILGWNRRQTEISDNFSISAQFCLHESHSPAQTHIQPHAKTNPSYARAFIWLAKIWILFNESSAATVAEPEYFTPR